MMCVGKRGRRGVSVFVFGASLALLIRSLFLFFFFFFFTTTPSLNNDTPRTGLLLSAAVNTGREEGESAGASEIGVSLWHLFSESKSTKSEQHLLHHHDYDHDHDYNQQEDHYHQLFLLPHLLYGPNNQYHGLKEAMVMARALNRTLVLPRIMKHYTQFTKNTPRFYPIEEVLDIARLSLFVPTISLQQFRAVCNGKKGQEEGNDNGNNGNNGNDDNNVNVAELWRTRIQPVYLEFEKRFEEIQEVRLGPRRVHLGAVHETTDSGDVFFQSVGDIIRTLGPANSPRHHDYSQNHDHNQNENQHQNQNQNQNVNQNENDDEDEAQQHLHPHQEFYPLDVTERCVAVSCLYGSVFDFSGDLSKNKLLSETLHVSSFVRFHPTYRQLVHHIHLLEGNYLALHIRTDERELKCIEEAAAKNSVCFGLGRPYFHLNLPCLVQYVEDVVDKHHLDGVYLATASRTDGLVEALRKGSFKTVTFEDYFPTTTNTNTNTNTVMATKAAWSEGSMDKISSTVSGISGGGGGIKGAKRTLSGFERGEEDDGEEKEEEKEEEEEVNGGSDDNKDNYNDDDDTQLEEEAASAAAAVRDRHQKNGQGGEVKSSVAKDGSNNNNNNDDDGSIELDLFVRSTLEQEIAIQATFFMGTRQSTWTQFVLESRLSSMREFELNQLVDDLPCSTFYSLNPKKKKIVLKEPKKIKSVVAKP